MTRLAGNERAATVQLVAALAEVDARRLYLGQGCSSLFTYCTQVLRLSEHAAYGRIEAARASRRFPVLLEKMASGELTLTAVCLLAPHLSDANHRDVLTRATHRSKRQVEEIVASLHPRPDAPAIVRKLPGRLIVPDTEKPAAGITVPPSVATTAPAAAPTPPDRAVVEPLAPARYKLQVTIDRATHEKLRRVQDLMRHSLPSGDLATILDRALSVLLSELERKKIGISPRTRLRREATPGSRHIPAAVRRSVWQRDGGRCAFSGAYGRCTETGRLEFHHVRPFASGGEPTEDNVELRCRAHNQYEADLFFADPFIARECGAPYTVNSVRTEFARDSPNGSSAPLSAREFAGRVTVSESAKN